MAAIAERRLGGMFAAAKENLAGFAGSVFLRAEFGVFMRPIAKGLLAGLTTGAPEIALALGHFDSKGTLLGDGWRG